MRLEDYAMVGDTQTAALVGRNGSIDWLCFPQFDSGACFAALLGRPEHGHWKIAPRADVRQTRRRYRDATLILETEMETDDGVVRIIDFMPIRSAVPDLVRIVEGVKGEVAMELELVIRYDYGSIVPWVRREDDRLHAVAGPDALVLRSDVRTEGRGKTTVASFTVRAGDRLSFVLSWHPSYTEMPVQTDPDRALRETYEWWHEWARSAMSDGHGDQAPPNRRYHDAVVRSLLTLKALTFQPSGGIVAAPTTSLPEVVGGGRNWDYRYCWLRDATFTLQALLHSGFREEARAWREWLVRAVAGESGRLQILYGIRGERRIDERDLEWLPGYEGSRPVRVGNAAVCQRQLDVYGELMDVLYLARSSGLDASDNAWSVQRRALDWLEGHWDEPDETIWEVRAPRQQFTFSKIMAWVAFDRAAKTVEHHQVAGPAERWSRLAKRIHDEVCTRGFDRERNTFTQVYGSSELDASLLLAPILGFLPGSDPRVLGTIEAIERELMVNGLVHRYQTRDHGNIDGVPGREGAFLACSFWLVDALVLAGRRDEATAMFDHLLDVRNDVGLLAEQYDAVDRRLLGNFPQAFSHVALINSARNLLTAHGPAEERATRGG